MTKKKDDQARPSSLADVKVGDTIIIRVHRPEGGWLSVLEEVTATGEGWVACSSGRYNRWTGEGSATGSSHGKVGKGQASIATAVEWARLEPPFTSARAEHKARKEAEEREREDPASQIGTNLEGVKAETWMKLGLEKLLTIAAWLEETPEEKP